MVSDLDNPSAGVCYDFIAKISKDMSMGIPGMVIRSIHLLLIDVW